MRKLRIEYDSPLDALVAIAKRLNAYERRYKMESEEFFGKYGKGESEDTEAAEFPFLEIGSCTGFSGQQDGI